ncbi:MAG TPA: hypothetical protein DCL41_09980 [Bdellovibrionales bacterium]|nr:hypothetical protein [Pseudobdellovibrionaceae bacterium]HAG92192.1 hypothetical protein [Bdellovibrionales bacterium]
MLLQRVTFNSKMIGSGVKWGSLSRLKTRSRKYVPGEPIFGIQKAQKGHSVIPNIVFSILSSAQPLKLKGLGTKGP